MRLAALAAGLFTALVVGRAAAQDILFVTQPPFGSDFTTVNSTFGNHRGHTGAAPRGGDLYIRYADGTLRNLTAEAGFGLVAGQEIAVREPSVHWSGGKALFSMVVGGTTKNVLTPVYWQIYEVTGLARGATAVITRLSQPPDYNNVSPLYGRDDGILFTSDRPRNGNRMLYPQLDEYESAPTNTGLWAMAADGSDLRLLDHAVSGVFTPIVASDGRVVMTRWDHLQRDQQNYPGATYGAFNYVSEESTVSTGNAVEIFPEPRIREAGSSLHGHRINIFLPWQIFEDGTGHETLNHVGRHELSRYFDSSRDGLPDFSPPANRRTADHIFHLKEDPTRPGYFLATVAPEFQTHAAGQVIGLAGGESVNADDMQIDHVTDPISASPLSESTTTPPGHPGLFRNPVPLSDGRVLAVRTTEARADRRTGGSLSSRYDFHLAWLEPGTPYRTPGSRLIPGGITKAISYFDNYEYRQHTYDGVLWELDPVEVRPRPRPPVRSDPLPAIEATLLADELGADGVAALRQFLRDNEMALIVSRNVTRRADRQQDFNLKVAGSTTQTAVPGSTPVEVAFMQFYQADQIRGYATFNQGRRPIAALLHDGLLPDLPGAPPSSVRVAADGSVAAFVPASRALTWQLVGSGGQAVVRERYWVSFSSGEIRVCANCHGVNRSGDVVLGQSQPTNPPEALRELVSWWQENFAPEPTPTPIGTARTVSGRVRYDGSGLAVADVGLRATGPSTLDRQSDGGGEFAFAELAAANWMISPSKLGAAGGAVTAYDAAMVLRSTLGQETLEGLAAVACDTTGNGELSPLDAVRILQYSLGSLARLPVADACGSDWVFAPPALSGVSQRRIEPTVATGECTAGSIAFEPLAADATDRDFTARVFGDCSGNWTAPSAAALQHNGGGRTGAPAGSARLRLGRPRRGAHGDVEIPVWLHTRRAAHSLDLRIEVAGDTSRVGFRPAALPEGALVQHEVSAGRVALALASGRGLAKGSMRLGTLVVPGSPSRHRPRRDWRATAHLDDVAIRVQLPR